MTPSWWLDLEAELEQLRLVASEHRSGARRWESVNALSAHHERMCIALLRHHGWVADHWGQALISEQLREALKATHCPARWSPDVLAVRGRDWVLIDCKAEVNNGTPNHSIEVAALEAMVAWAMANTDAHGRCGYVWHDFSWTDALRLHMTGEKERGRPSTNGSGTPYWLFPKTLGENFRDRFGHHELVVR